MHKQSNIMNKEAMLGEFYKKAQEYMIATKGKYKGQEFDVDHLPNKDYPNDWLGITIVPRKLIGKMHTTEGQKF